MRSSVLRTAFSSPRASASICTSFSSAHSYTMERPPSAIAFCVSSMRRTSGCTMMGSAGPDGFFLPVSERMARRSLAYHSAFWKDSSAAATPCTAVPRREVLMNVNMWFMPRLAVPMRKPSASSKLISQVEEPWQPILSSMRPILQPLRSPLAPSSPTLRFGTRKSEMPLMPSGASGRRASTQCTTFSVMSWSPHEMKILVPVILYEPSGCGTALVLTCARSLPHCGSVRHIVPVHSPLMSGGRYLSFSASVPCSRMVLMAPLLRPGYIVHVQQAVAAISVPSMASEYGRPWPPYFSGYDSPCHPPAVNVSYASLNPGGVFTS
mmetsp:Transcript_2828/g.10007  ORF Transcript_2828/g.10007 Transcript_2828/m.10007 type:complete len:323 (-) Transcript_2828:424-1392(-)